MKVMEKVPYVKGLDQWIGTEINEDAIARISRASARPPRPTAIELYASSTSRPRPCSRARRSSAMARPCTSSTAWAFQRVRESYPCVWKNLNAKPKLCFMGCPHMTLHQLIDTTERVEAASGHTVSARSASRRCSPRTRRHRGPAEYAPRLRNTGVVLSYICPLMYMNNPLSKAMPSSPRRTKLRTYDRALLHRG